MQSHFATKSQNLQLNREANGNAIGSPFKCKVPFGKARGPAQAPNRRTSHIRGRSGLAVRSNVWNKGPSLRRIALLVFHFMAFCRFQLKRSRSFLV